MISLEVFTNNQWMIWQEEIPHNPLAILSHCFNSINKFIQVSKTLEAWVGSFVKWFPQMNHALNLFFFSQFFCNSSWLLWTIVFQHTRLQKIWVLTSWLTEISIILVKIASNIPNLGYIISLTIVNPRFQALCVLAGQEYY